MSYRCVWFGHAVHWIRFEVNNTLSPNVGTIGSPYDSKVFLYALPSSPLYSAVTALMMRRLSTYDLCLAVFTILMSWSCILYRGLVWFGLLLLLKFDAGIYWQSMGFAVMLPHCAGVIFCFSFVPINERLVDVWNARGCFVLVHRILGWSRRSSRG